MHPATDRFDPLACQAALLGGGLAYALLKVLSLSSVAAASPLGLVLWVLGCALLAAWLLAACIACLALSRPVFLFTALVAVGLGCALA
ncbi:hypothetical protein [Stenotrophomonas sp. 24(2023)]|uniref:hypothetical protein n=1 Tax=Stenotrophomonas sp. 24(2023) TaxID=3068324 RepID=UPI0027E03F3B|nr:hypothetical protein [Stenotrophomonas sp. 24(2023)]WMJ69637.1 hypothetical protein Q9R17_00575 [Stenotrophomonas sp. 24(2023)]